MKIQSIVLSILFISGSMLFSSCGGSEEARDDKTDKQKAEKEAEKKAAKERGDYSTAEFFVRGNCGMCRERIVNALDEVDGVLSADWKIESSMASVRYEGEKVTEEDLHEAVANVGHRTEEFDANEEAYSELPPCCLDPDDPNYIEM